MTANQAPRMGIWTRIVVSQIVAFLVVFGAHAVVQALAAPPVPLAALLVAAGAVAAGLGLWWLGVARWWLLVQIALPWLIWTVSRAPVPSWLWLALGLVLWLIFWNSPGLQVPLYLSNRPTRAALAKLLPPRRGFRFADLGSGLGNPLIGLARERPDGHFTGFETAPLPFAISWLRRRAAGCANLDIVRADFRKEDLSAFDVVYCFLSPAPMPELYRKARAEMRPGTLLVSNSFIVPDVNADATIEVGDRRGTRLYIWRM